jgi:MFS family permease
LSRVVGPAIAGAIIAQIGLAPCFYINGLSFGAVLFCLYLMDGHALAKSKPVRAAKGQLRAGFAYAWKTPVVRDVLIMMALVGTLSYEFTVSLPLLAHITFSGSPSAVARAVALFMTSMGVGAVLGGLYTAGRRTATMRALTVGAFGFGVAMLLVAISPSMIWAAVAMGVVGFFSVSFTALTNTILQISSAARMRGRVMAVWAMAFLGSTVIGGPVIGWVGQNVGPRWSLVAGAVAAIVAGGVGVSAMRARGSEVSQMPAPGPALEEDASA